MVMNVPTSVLVTVIKKVSLSNKLDHLKSSSRPSSTVTLCLSIDCSMGMGRARSWQGEGHTGVVGTTRRLCELLKTARRAETLSPPDICASPFLYTHFDALS
eukprot:scaffold232792_cov36-Tisochrysis_lutea.AAC.1